MRTAFSTLFMCVALLCPAHARIEPRFLLEHSTWNATDIVVLEHRADNTFEVQEVFKGQLTPGTLVELPEVAPGNALINQAAEGSSLNVWRARVYAFLKRKGTTWDGADLFGGMPFACVWEMNDRLYAFDKNDWTRNQARFMLLKRRVKLEDGERFDEQSESEFLAEVEHLLAQQNALFKALAKSDQRERAQALEAVVATSDDFEAQEEAVKALRDCGLAGEEVLSRVLHNPEAVNTLVFLDAAKSYVAGGEAAQRDLASVAASERRYVAAHSATRCSVQERWRKSCEEFELHMGRLYYALAVLAGAKCKQEQCEIEASSVIGLWNRDPKLRAEKGQSDQVKEAAIRLLRVARQPVVRTDR